MDRLPDDLVILIVSLLPMKEAVMTSVFARRWRRFWTYNRTVKFSCEPFNPPLDVIRSGSREWYHKRIDRINDEKEMEWRAIPRMKKLTLQFNVKLEWENCICMTTLRCIKLAPKLCELVIILVGVPHKHYDRSRRPRYLRNGFDKVEPCPILGINQHKHLKVLEIRGGGATCKPLVKELALFLMECAASLDTAVINGVPYAGEKALPRLEQKLAKVVVPVTIPWRPGKIRSFNPMQ